VVSSTLIYIVLSSTGVIIQAW